MASVCVLQVAVFFTKFKVLSVASTTESSYPGLPAPFSGVGNNRAGGVLVAVSLLIFLSVVALATPLGRLTQQELPGSKFSRSTSTGSLPKRNNGGTGKELYE